MAKQYWGSNQGDVQEAIVTQSSDPNKAVEVVVDLAQSLSREDVLVQIDQIKNVIISGIWPPA